MKIRRYLTESGRDVFGEWLAGMKDERTKAKIIARIDRLSVGNFGNCKSLAGGLFELKVDWGPGYRIYYALISKECVLLLGGGEKRRQVSDIDHARKHLADYKERTL